MKLKLIDNWKKGWKFISVNCMVMAQAILGAWMMLPSDMKELMPNSIVFPLTMLLLAGGIVGRFVDQGDGTK